MSGISNVNYPFDLIKSGSSGRAFSYFAHTLCQMKVNGIDGLQLPQAEISLHSEVVRYASLCVRLIKDGTTDFYYDFLVNLEYQNILLTKNDEKLFLEMYVIKSLAKLLRALDVANIYYLIQHHCTADVSEPLLSKIINTFGADLKW